MKKSSQLQSFIRSISELRALFSLLEVDSRKLFVSAFVLLIASLAAYASTHLFIQLIQCLTNLGDSVDSVLLVRNLVLLMVASKATSAGFSYYSSLLLEQEMREVDARVRSRTFEKLMSFGQAYYDKHSVPKLNQLMHNVAQKSGERLKACHALLAAVFKLSVILIFLFKVFWIPATMVAISVTVTVVLAIRSQAFYQILSMRIKNASESLDEKMLNLLQGHALVKISNTEEKETRRFEHLARRSAKFRTELFKFERLLSIIGEGSFLGQTLLLAAMTPWLLESGDKNTIGQILTFFLIMRPIESTVIKLTRSFTLMSRSSRVYSSLSKLLEVESKTYVVSSGKKVLKSLKTEIEFRNLNFSYPNILKYELFQNFILKIQKNQWVVLMGENGAGKSTLTQLLLGMYRAPKGTIFINSYPIEKYTSKSLRSQFAVVPQNPVFLDGTIAQALSYGAAGRLSDADMINNLEKVGLTDWFQTLPQGFETRIGAGGIQLSGGERQKLAIARALLSTGEILILDEALSAVDAASKARILETLKEERVKRTILMITHDPEDAKYADSVVSLNRELLKSVA